MYQQQTALHSLPLYAVLVDGWMDVAQFSIRELQKICQTLANGVYALPQSVCMQAAVLVSRFYCSCCTIIGCKSQIYTSRRECALYTNTLNIRDPSSRRRCHLF